MHVVNFCRLTRLNFTLIMNVETRSRRLIKRQNDIIQINLKTKSPPTLDSYAHRSETLTLGAIETVARQLGYHPYNIVDVVFQKCVDTSGADHHPLVAVLYPLNHNEEVGGRYAGRDGPKPFPTTFWMTCPDLHTRISKLEDLGYINKFQLQLLNDLNSAQWLQQMHDAHRSYATFRWNLLSEDDKLLIDSSGWTSALRDVGIAGIRDFDRVKCLHCHYAHHIGRPEDRNLIGTWIHELLLNNIDATKKLKDPLQEEEQSTEQIAEHKESGMESVEAIRLEINNDNLIEENTRSKKIEKENIKNIDHAESITTTQIFLEKDKKCENLPQLERQTTEDKFAAVGMTRVIFTGTYSAGELDTSESRMGGILKTEKPESSCCLSSCFVSDKGNDNSADPRKSDNNSCLIC